MMMSHGDGLAPWAKPEERPAKRARTDDGKEKGRNSRMFGLLANTLKTAKDQATVKTDAVRCVKFRLLHLILTCAARLSGDKPSKSD